LSNKKILIQ